MVIRASLALYRTFPDAAPIRRTRLAPQLTLRTRFDANGMRDLLQAFVAGPELAFGKQRGGDEMRVDPAQTKAVQFVALDEIHNLLAAGWNGSRESAQIGEDLSALVEVSAGQFPDDRRVPDHPAALQ